MNTNLKSPYASFKAYASIVNNRYGTSCRVGAMRSATLEKKCINTDHIFGVGMEVHEPVNGGVRHHQCDAQLNRVLQ